MPAAPINQMLPLVKMRGQTPEIAETSVDGAGEKNGLSLNKRTANESPAPHHAPIYQVGMRRRPSRPMRALPTPTGGGWRRTSTSTRCVSVLLMFDGTRITKNEGVPNARQ